jgi:hypothetical protein
MENGATPLEEIQGYLPLAVLLPLRDTTILKDDLPEIGKKAGDEVPGSKAALDKDWPDIPFCSTQNPLYQARLQAHLGTGVLLGAASGDICAIDCDSPERARQILKVNPWLADTLRISGRPGREQFFVRIKGDYPATTKKNNLEWRSDRSYSVVRGIHFETGGFYRIVHGASPVEIEFLKIIWPPGGLFGRDGGQDAAKDTSWTKDYAGLDFQAFDLVACLRSLGFKLKPDVEDPEKYILRCPWREEHKGQGRVDKERDAAIFQRPGEQPGYNCFHSHCAGRGLRDFLELIKAKQPDIDLKRFTWRAEEQTLSSVPWPVMAEAAFHGILGKIVRAIEPESEADPAAMLVMSVVAFGNKCGRAPYFQVEGTQHHTNLFCCVVGRTARSRKGTAWDRVRYIFTQPSSHPGIIEPEWKIQSGVSTGEGVIWHLRNETYKKGKSTDGQPAMPEVDDEGVIDKRLLLAETEFSRVLAVMAREGNILSEVFRQAWDHGNLSSMTKSSPYRATGAHLSVCGQTTQEELTAKLKETELFNGFANRFLWVLLKRSKILPQGGRTDIASELLAELDKALWAARDIGEMSRSDQAQQLWLEVYPKLTNEARGKIAAITGRGDAQVLRLSMIYALADSAAVIEVEHLGAALAIWKYCEDSVKYLFGRTIDDKQLVKLYQALRAAPDGLTQDEILKNVFRKNLASKEIGKLLEVLEKAGHIFCRTRARKDGKGGKPATVWFATD